MMISYQEAKKIVEDQGRKRGLATKTVLIADAIGQICAEEVFAPIDIQPFDNSAMDGFAVQFADLQGANQDNPVSLEMSGTIAAGDIQPTQNLTQGYCTEIMTGAPIPPKADVVVPVEMTSCQDNTKIMFPSALQQGANIRYAGEDFKKGQLVLQKGTRIQPQHIMVLATLGIHQLVIFQPLQAVFLSTGNEVIDDLSQDLLSGQIYNSNRPYGLAMLRDMGVLCHEVPKLPDDVDSFVSLLKSWMEQDLDLIISSGAVSAGKFDFVRQGLEAVGAEILFHKVKMKPGKPNLFARLPNGTLYFGLPGNPVATVAGLRFFVRPCIDTMLQQKSESPVFAVANNEFLKKTGVCMFLKGKLNADKKGQLSVQIMGGQQSFMVAPFVDMNVWVMASTESDKISEGDLVEVYPFYRNIQL